MKKIEKSKGLNASEKRLTRLGEKIFLGLWSYSNVYYESGKELTDLLVVCDKHVLIFSDKNNEFDTTKELGLAWKRWNKNAILKSIEQLRRAERIIKNSPKNIFLDPKCTQSLPITLPDINEMKIHLICIANGATDACKKHFNNKYTGSLPFSSDINVMKEPEVPKEFYITDYDRSKTFVHVFDDFTFPFILDELDTLTDFVKYLAEKERFIRNEEVINYTGEEDLLLHYIFNYDYKRKCNTFVGKTQIDISSALITSREDDWYKFKNNTKYIEKKKADEISYYWDRLIQMVATSYFNGIAVVKKPKDSTHEGAMRYMALEDRFHRRILSERLDYAVKHYPQDKSSSTRYLRYIESIYNGIDQAYLFLIVDPLPSDIYEQYVKNRREILKEEMLCLKAEYVSEKPKKKLNRIIGIAMESSNLSSGSTDFMLVEVIDWDDKKQSIYDSIRKENNSYNITSQKRSYTTEKYPNPKKKIGRNDPCPCGSYKKYKKCCLK